MQDKTNDEKKKYLKQYIKCKAAVVRIEEQMTTLQSSKMFPAGKIITDMPMGQGGVGDLSEYATKYDELLTLMKSARYEQINTYTEIFKRIEQLDDEIEKQILTLKYIKGMSWETICTTIHFEWSWTHRIHKQALEHFNI